MKKKRLLVKNMRKFFRQEIANVSGGARVRCFASWAFLNRKNLVAFFAYLKHKYMKKKKVSLVT